MQPPTTPPQADRRANDRETPAIPTTVQLTLHEYDGSRAIVAQILSISYSGLGITCNQPLNPGTKLNYTHPTRDKIITARIAWCKPNETHGFEHGINNESFDPSAKIDYYSILEVAPNAEPCMIDAAHQFLSHRYHPDNPATANPLIYARLDEAYKVLSDPIKRTAYESERALTKNGPAVTKGARNRDSIRSTRAQMLDMLYWRRVESPYKPVITIHEFETILKLPKEQMEFNLWFLRDKGLIARSDNACFVITADGVVWAEEVASQLELDEHPESPVAAATVEEPELQAV